MSILSLPKTVLNVTDEAVFVYKVSGKNADLLGVYPWQDEGFEASLFSAIVNDANMAPVILLNDTVDQHYRKERVPSVGVFESGTVVKRKLAIAFPKYPFRAYKKLSEVTPSKKTASGDRTVKTATYLFAACPETQNIQKVMNVLKDTDVSISGFGLLPTESVNFVEAISRKIFGGGEGSKKTALSFLSKKKAPPPKSNVWTIFIGQNRSGGLRQIVTKGGELALTRITPIVETDEDVELWTGDIFREYQATMTYLSRFGYTPNDTLNIIAVSSEHCKQSLEKVLTPENGSFRALTLSEMSKFMGYNPDLETPQNVADDAHVLWAANQARLSMPLSAPQLDAVANPRRYATFASIALIFILGASVYYASNAFINLYKLNQNISQAEKELIQVTNIYEDEVTRKEDMGVSIQLVQASFQINEELQKEKIELYDVLSAISEGLNDTFSLKTIDYEVNEVEVVSDETLGFVPPGTTRLEKKMVLTMEFPGDFDIAEGNAIVKSFSDRLGYLLPESSVSVTQVLKDVSYRGAITSESGVNTSPQNTTPLEGKVQILIDDKIIESSSTGVQG